MAQLGWTFDPDNPVYEVYAKSEKKNYNWRGVQAYLWSRTILCPDCTGLIPLSPIWRLSQKPGFSICSHQTKNAGGRWQ